MTPKPIAIGLLLCDRVIVDKDTNSPSAIGIFTGLAVERFPSDPQRFSVLAMLTDAQGDGHGKLAAYALDVGSGKMKSTPRSTRFDSPTASPSSISACARAGG